MPQTLLALAALLVFSLYALGRHQDDAATERQAVGAEVERALAGVARDRFAALERLAFAQEDIGRRGLRTSPPASPLGLDPGEAAAWPFNDLDDVDGIVEDRAAPTGTGTVAVTVRYAVRYVDPLNPDVTSAAPTLAKEVAVTVAEVAGPQTAGRPPAQAVLRRVFTPAGMASALVP